MKKSFVRMIATALVLLTVVSFMAACGSKNAGGGKRITFMYSGDTVQMKRYKTLIDSYNATAGKEAGITVVASPKPSGLESLLPSQLPSDSSPDVVALWDRNFKLYIEYYQDLTDYINEETISAVYPNSINRYRYNPATTTSNPEDPLYGVTMYNDATVLYYNKTLIEQNGVICISVPEENLDEFNAGTFVDGNGKTKADYGITVDVPAKGYYRSINPYVPMEGELDGTSWVAPQDGEVLIFNDRIAMNWDELDDIGMLCTKKWNANSATQYGFYTEWWFNYGWSVGGDCVEDLSGSGDWTYTLPSDIPNYIVNEGKTYTGAYTGTVYQAGETLDFKDILNAKPGDTIGAESEGNTTFYFTVNGSRAEVRDFAVEVNDGTLDEMPSMRTAIERFYSLAGKGGKDICPYPSVISSVGSTGFFGSEKLAFLIEQVSQTHFLNERAVADDYSVAVMPRYKTYTDPTDPNCDEIETLGKIASHSQGYVLIMSAKSSMKEEAAHFMSWVATDGQKALLDSGEISSAIADQDLMREKFDQINPEVLLDSLEVAKPGDWWYMKNTRWIDIWAVPLNNQVRGGQMSFDEWIYGYIDRTNEYLEGYKTN